MSLIHPVGKQIKSKLYSINEKDEKVELKLNDNQIQPNTIDIQIAKMFEIYDFAPFVINDSSKTMRSTRQMTESQWFLSKGGVYLVDSNVYIEVAENEVAWIVGRSTFNRNGVFITSSIYDSGFKGTVGATLYNMLGQTNITKGTRFGHLVIAQSESLAMYNGSYQDKK